MCGNNLKSVSRLGTEWTSNIRYKNNKTSNYCMFNKATNNFVQTSLTFFVAIVDKIQDR